MIRRLVYIALGVLLTLFAVSFLLSSEFKVERATEVAAQPGQIYPLLNNLERWQRWWPWYEEDERFQPRFEGPDRGPGAAMAWDSFKFGEGRLVLQAADPLAGITYDMQVEQGHMHITGSIRFEPGIMQRVVWDVSGSVGSSLLDRTLGKYFVLFADRNLGPSMEQGLANLKRIAESKDEG
ncbi:MAG: hypothetical protein EYC70_01795 [Planctomycetota bacterium]|nr:MAG: hypothetical protein EYC70_01795 [Planctomycetota bacterium]